MSLPSPGASSAQTWCGSHTAAGGLEAGALPQQGSFPEQGPTRSCVSVPSGSVAPRLGILGALSADLTGYVGADAAAAIPTKASLTTPSTTSGDEPQVVPSQAGPESRRGGPATQQQRMQRQGSPLSLQAEAELQRNSSPGAPQHREFRPPPEVRGDSEDRDAAAGSGGGAADGGDAACLMPEVPRLRPDSQTGAPRRAAHTLARARSGPRPIMKRPHRAGGARCCLPRIRRCLCHRRNDEMFASCKCTDTIFPPNDINSSCARCSRRAGTGAAPIANEDGQRRVAEEAAAMGVTPQRMTRILANRRSAAAAKAKKAQYYKVFPRGCIGMLHIVPPQRSHLYTSSSSQH